MKIQTNIAEGLKCQRTAQLYTGNSLKNKIYRKGHAFYLMVLHPKRVKFLKSVILEQIVRFMLLLCMLEFFKHG